MKKITRIAALLAAGALLFGAFGCSSGGDGDETPSGPQTETVSYTLKDTPGFDSGSLKVSGMNTTDDTSDDTFEMTLKLADEEEAKTVTGTWELTETGFVCKSDANVTIGDITVNAGESVPGTLNEDNSEITLEVSDVVRLVFVKDEDSGGTGGATSATVKYLQLTNTSNSSNVTPDWSATVSDTSVVTATDLVWTLVDGLTHKQWDIKAGLNNNGVAEAQLEEQTTGEGKENGLASVSFDITAVKALKLKTISAITSSGKTPTGITCWIDGEAVAQGVQYSDAATKAFKLSDASLDDYEVAAGDTVTIKITSDKTSKATEGAKIDFSQISLTVETAGTTGGIQGGGQQGGGDNSGNTGNDSGNTGDNSGSGNENQSGGDNSGNTGNTGDNTGNTGDNSGNTGGNTGNTGNTGNGNENQGGGNESGDQGGEGGGEDGGEEEPAEEPVPFTGSFVGLNGASFGLDPLTKETDLKGTTELKSADGSISASLKSNDGGGNLKITVSNGKATGIKYNGSSLKNGTDSLQSTVDVSTLTRYISVPVKNGETITVSYTANTSGSGNTTAKVVLANKADGSILQTETVDTTTTTGNKDAKTISTTVSNDIDVLILFSREGAGGGGIIVTGFEIQ